MAKRLCKSFLIDKSNIFVTNLEKRNDMSEKYRARVAKFLKDMTETPVITNDYWQPSLEKLNNLMNCKGKRDHMVFKAPRCDADIKDQMKEYYSVIDPTPAKPERDAWNMRPRDKDREIGP